MLPEAQALDWFIQMCLALKFIHDRRILHRCSSALLSTSPGTPTPRERECCDQRQDSCEDGIIVAVPAARSKLLAKSATMCPA